MWESIRKMWKIPELRNKILYTLGMLLLFRLVGVIPAPGVDAARVLTGTATDLPILQLVNMMTGSNFANMTIMAMGITPYINASIIMQLLTIAIPALERMQRDEEGGGREKIARITRYVTVGLAAVQAIGLVAGLGYIKSGWFNYVLVGNPDINIKGAPIGTLVCYGLIATVNLVIVWRLLAEKPNYLKVFAKPVLASAADQPGIYMRLEVVRGAQRTKRTEFTLRDELHIGRAPACDIAFDDETLSLRNSRVFLDQGAVYLEDLQSQNGTRVNGTPVYAPVRLRSGDEISVGSASFRLKF